MKSASFVAVLAVAVLAAGLSAPRGVEAAMKCRDAGDRQPLLVLDGRFDPRSPTPEELRALDMSYLTVLCWDPKRRVLQRGEGEPVIYVETSTFLESIHGDLARVADAQRRYAATHQRYAGDLAALDVGALTPGISIEVDAVDSGWQAAASGELFTQTCHVFEGAIQPPARGLAESTPTCVRKPEFVR